MVIDSVSRVVFGVIEALIGLAMFAWPNQLRMASLKLFDRSQKPLAPLTRGPLLVQRFVGLALILMGVVVAANLELNSLAFAVGAIGAVAIGLVMIVRPAEFRSLTNPDWQRYEKFALSGTSLGIYRLTGLAFLFIGVSVLWVVLSRGQ